jgi:hypothetical protein
MSKSKRRRDSEAKVKKHVSLTQAGAEQIQAWADAQGISFSAAIEGLALIGIDDELTNGLLQLIQASINRTFALNINRFAKLISFAGIEASAAKYAARGTYFLQLLDRVEGIQDPSLIRGRITVDPETPVGGEIAHLITERDKKQRWDAVKDLKKPLAELAEIAAMWEEDADGATSTGDHES